MALVFISVEFCMEFWILFDNMPHMQSTVLGILVHYTIKSNLLNILWGKNYYPHMTYEKFYS